MPNRFLLRVELPDRPGSLAALARAIATIGANVVSVDVHELDGASAVDDIIVTFDGDPDALVSQLAESGHATVHSCHPLAATSDTVVRVLDWARHVLEAGIGYSDLELGRVLLRLCSADAVAVMSCEEALSGDADSPGAIGDAIRSGTAQLAWSEALPAFVVGPDASRTGWLAAIPDHRDQPAAVAFVVRHRADPFTSTEIARARALLALHRELVPARARTSG